MVVWIIVGIALTGVLAVWLGFVPPPYATTLIKIRDGEIRVRRGRLQGLAREHISDILRDAGVSRGFIAITSANWIVFSRQIPGAVHQRLRNVLLNQWA
jgi:hypothetical protein